MIAAPIIPDDALPPVLDWAALVAEGHALLGAMGDGRWTDYNAHDPGITMLEAFAFALTDLGYRAGHPVADLVAGALPAPGRDALLAGLAVTRGDRRAAALAAPGVGAAWVEPATAATLRLRHAADRSELALTGEGNGDEAPGDPVALVGVERVLLDKAAREDLTAAELVRGVAAVLHRQRGLGEDIDAIEVLAPMPVVVEAELEVDDPGRADAVLLAAYAALADLIAPPRGRAIDAQSAPARPTALHLSDAIAVLAGLDGVRGVRRVRIGADRIPAGSARWSLPVPADRAARFDPRTSRIRLVAGGGFVLDSALRDDLLRAFGARIPPAEPPRAASAPVRGRDRALAAYRPLRFDLPAAYGVAPGTLPAAAGPERRAQAAQLRGYLGLLDALLANQFAQLAAAGSLLGPGAPRSCFSQVAGPDEDDRPVHAEGFDPQAMQALVEPPGDPAGIARRNRLLAILLARHGEEAPVALPAPSAAPGEPGAARRVLDSRTRLLADIARLTAARGTGADLLHAADEPALLDRIRLKAGLTAAEGARMRLVEHILLRPFAGDDPARALLSQVTAPDPFSLQLTLVLDDALRPRAVSDDDPALLRVARAETPAHLVLHLLWLDAATFDAFDAAYRGWRRTLAAERREALGFPAEPA